MSLILHTCSNRCCRECKEKRRQLRQLRKQFIKEADPTAVQAIVNEQVALLGSDLLYQRINRNLKQHRFESVFAHEQCKLYTWREDFFYKLCGQEPSHFDFRMPYHITRNFDAVTALFLSDKLQGKPVDYFEENQDQSSNARVFDKEGMEIIAVDMQDLEDVGLGFNDAAQMILALHRKGPCSLLEAALKAVALHDLPLNEVPREVRKKALQGMYELDDQVPDCLSHTGKQLYQMLRTRFLMETALKAVVLNNLPLNEVPREVRKKALKGMYELEDQVSDCFSHTGKQLYQMLRTRFLEKNGVEELEL